jgi:hypothetical protein
MHGSEELVEDAFVGRRVFKFHQFPACVLKKVAGFREKLLKQRICRQ